MKKKEEQTIVLSHTLNEKNALWALFFIAHGFGHIWQYQHGRAPIINKHINKASVQPGIYNLEQKIKSEGITAKFEDVFRHMEAEATSIGLTWIKNFLDNPEFNIDKYVINDDPNKLQQFYDDLNFCLNLIGVIDHTFHRNSINQMGVGTYQDAWFENFGLVMSNILALWQLEQMSNPFKQKLPFDLEIVKSDGTFHSLNEQESCALMQKYQQWQKAPPFSLFNIKELTNGPIPDTYRIQHYVSIRHDTANQSGTVPSKLESVRFG